MKGQNYRIAGELTRTDKVMNDTFWIGLQPALTEEMLAWSVDRIETILGLKF